MFQARSALFALALGVAACGPSFVPANTAEPILLESGDPSEVRAAIIRAMKLRKFHAQREEPGKIVARLTRGDEMVEVAIEYSGSQFLVRYLKSTGIEKFEAGGELLIDDKVDSYKRKLAVVIEKELKRPARERAEAERDRREYELMLARAKAGTDRPVSPGEPAQPSGGPDIGGIVQQIAPSVLPQGSPPAVEVNGSVRHSEQSLTCCINGRKYECPGQAAFNECFKNGPSQCTPAGGC